MLHKIYALTFIFSCFVSFVGAQNCLPEGIVFETQGEIDSFPINYPGCKIIEGDVCIGDCTLPYLPSDINNLDSLVQLTSIKGNITISSNPSLLNLDGLQNLTIIEGLTINNNDSLNSLEGLQQIEQINGSFSLLKNHSLTSIDGFELIDTIAGSLRIINLDQLSTIDAFANLKFLGGYEIDDNYNLVSLNDFNYLEFLGYVYIHFNWRLNDLPDFPLITHVFSDFVIRDNFNLDQITGFESIKRVSGSLEISTTVIPDLRTPKVVMNINAFHNLTFVGGDLRIYFEDYFGMLDGFTKLDSIGNSLLLELQNGIQNFLEPHRFKYIGHDIDLVGIANIQDLKFLIDLDSIYGGLTLGNCPNIVSLSGIDHLNGLGGGFRLHETQLANLSEISNFKSIGGDLGISDCDLIPNLLGLEGIASIDGQLNISYNQNLLSLDGIQNIDPQSIHSSVYDIIILNNPNLNVCNLPNICAALHEYRKTYWIQGNASDCSRIEKIDCYDYGFSGSVFFDANQNKIQDQHDAGVPGIMIRLEPDNKLLLTNANGNFLAVVEEGTTHTLRIDHGADWILTTDSVSYTKTFYEGLPSNMNNNFGIFPAVESHELSINLSSDVTRCHEAVNFYLHTINRGSFPEGGRIALKYDPDVQFISASPAADAHNVILRELSWDIDTIYPFHERKIDLRFRMPGESSTGESLYFKATAFIDSADIEIVEDVFVYTPTVRCSYDPNDKLVMPAGVKQENYTLKDDILTYTVRFENNGNAEAINITIIDTMDADFDMSTFRVINSSHPVFASISGHEIQFFFENIWLREKKTGFVTYEIRALGDIQDFTPVSNHADIIFDFNQPIVTNTTLNTLVYEICEDVSMIIDTSICNGDNFLGFTETGIYLDTIHIGSTCDSFTVINLIVIGNETIVLDTAICEGESYLGYNASGSFIFDSINHVTGCMHQVELMLEILPLGLPPCLTSTDDIDEAHIKTYPNPTGGELYIETPEPIESLSLYTMDNRPVILTDQTLEGRHVKLRLNENIPDGFYILVIEQGGGKHYRKIIVSR